MKTAAALFVLMAATSFGPVFAWAKKETKPVPAAKATKPKPTPKPTQLDLLKGEWTDCRPFVNEAGEIITKGPTLGLRDLYTQVAPLSFTQAIARTSDKDCKKVVDEKRTTFDCDEVSPELLTCKTTKHEERKGSGKWKPAPKGETAGAQSEYTIKLAVVQKAPDTVSLTITSDASEESETFDLKKATK